MSAEFFRFLGLGITGGESGDFTSPFVKKLKGKMTETADADDSDPVGWLDTEICDGGKYRGTSTEERAGTQGIKSGGELEGPFPVRADAIGEAAVPTDDGRFAIGAELLPAGKAWLTGKATAGKPTESDPVSDGKPFCLIPDFFDDPDYLMPWDERVFRISPVVVYQGNIRMANAAGLDFDLNLIRFHFAGIEFKLLEFAALCLRAPSVECFAHVLISDRKVVGATAIFFEL